MLSPYFPVWLPGLISPVFVWLGGKLPGTYKPIVLFALCLVIVAAVIMASPLGWNSLIDQSIVLFGMVAAAYTIAKPIEKAGRPGGAIVAVLMACMLMCAFAAMAQAPGSEIVPPATDPALPYPGSDPAPPPIAETASVWLYWAASAVGAVIARWLRGKR